MKPPKMPCSPRQSAPTDVFLEVPKKSQIEDRGRGNQREMGLKFVESVFFRVIFRHFSMWKADVADGLSGIFSKVFFDTLRPKMYLLQKKI